MRKKMMNYFTVVIAIIIGGGFCLNAAAQTCAPAPVGLASWYTADGNALDSRSRNNGLLTGTAFVAGQNGQGIRFAAPLATENFSADGSGALDITGNQVTIEAWIKLENNSLQPAQAFTATIGKSGFPNDQTYNLLFEGGALANGTNLPADQWLFEYILTNSAGTRVHNQVTNVIVTADGNYHHFALTYDGAGSPTNNVKLYIDGVLQTTNIPGPHFLTGNLKSSPAEPFRISTGSSGSPFSADEVSVYNRALSTPEIAAIANAGTAGKCKPTATVSPSGQVAWFAGDGNVNDSSGTSNGTLGTSTDFSVGKVGQAFRTTSQTGGTVSFPHSPALNFTNAFSIEMWASVDQVGANNGTSFLACKGNCGSAGGFPFALVLNNTTSNVILRVGNGSTFASVFSSALPLNTFKHVVGTYDGTTMRIYVDGVLDGSLVTGIGTMLNSTGPFFVGGSNVGNLLGKYDETSLYNRALTQDEITSIFNAGIAGKLKQNAVVDTNSLVSLWQGEGSANDTRGSNNGTLNGTTFAAGKVGQALDPNDIIATTVADNISLNRQNLTLEAWFTAQPYSCVGCAQFIAAKSGSTGNFGYELGTARDTGQLRLSLNGGAGGADLFTSASVSDGNFHHVAATYDGATMKIFLDGALAAQRAIATTINYEANSSFVIGSRQHQVSTNSYNGLVDELGFYNRALTAAEIRADYEAGNALSTVVGDARITFPTVTIPGTTQQIPLDAALFPAVPLGTPTGLAYDIATSSVFTGSPTVCFNLPAFTSAQFTDLRALHFEGGGWVDVTNSAGSVFPSLCTSGVNSFSPFAIVQLAPSAASVGVGGRVLTAAGRGISKARVSITGPDGDVRTTMTNAFGYYQFFEVASGETYILSVRSKRYQFINPTRAVSVTEELTDADFIASH